MASRDYTFDLPMMSPASLRKDCCLDWLEGPATMAKSKQAALPIQATNLPPVYEVQTASPSSLNSSMSENNTSFFPPTTNSPPTASTHFEPHNLTNILTRNNPMPFTLPLPLLTTHSRLFALLAQDATQPSPGSSPNTTIELNVEHETFTVFDRWLRGGAIHVPTGDERGYATDVYLLMRAHAMGEALMTGVFTDAIMDEIIGLLSEESADGVVDGNGEVDIERLDAAAKARDLDILTPAAAAIWPAGSLGRDFFTDFVAQAPSYLHDGMAIQALCDTGDMDFVATVAMKCKARLVDWELGEAGVPVYVGDPCRYHGHRARGEPCYKRSKGSVFCGLEYAVRKVLGGEGYRGLVDEGGMFGE